MSHGLNFNRGSNGWFHIKIVFNFSRFKPARTKWKPVFGGFETRLNFIKFGHRPILVNKGADKLLAKHICFVTSSNTLKYATISSLYSTGFRVLSVIYNPYIIEA